MTLPVTITAPTTPHLTLIRGGANRTSWERRATMRAIVGGCPDHWWKPTAARTAACTCDRF